MKFKKNFNNNAALVEDSRGISWIVVGNGVGFGKHNGEPIDTDKVEQRYIAESQFDMEGVQDLNSEALLTTSKVIETISPMLKATFTARDYLSLADHIDFAYDRVIQHITFNDTAVRWEVKQLFPREYQAALEAIRIIKASLNIELPAGEAVFLTYHFVNVRSEGAPLADTIQLADLLQGVIQIVQLRQQAPLDEESFSFSRFVSHLRYFFIRRMKQQPASASAMSLDADFVTLTQQKYPLAWETTGMIGIYLQKQMGWQLSGEERVYLTLHIVRITDTATTK